MRVTIKKWGNSLATRLPKSIVESCNLHLNQAVEIDVIDGSVVISPVEQSVEYKLEDLLQQCPAEAMALSDDDKKWLNDKAVGQELL